MSRRITTVLALALLTACAAHADAQTLGTFRWQLQPFCNVVTLNIVGQGGTFTLDGFDDQCGAGVRASVVGTAFPNPDGTIGIGLNTVLAPGGAFVHVEARISLASLSGPWHDSAGNSGTFVFTSGAGSGGPARPVPLNGVAPGSVTAGQLSPGAVGGAQIDSAQVQARITGTCAVGHYLRGINQNGSVICEPAAMILHGDASPKLMGGIGTTPLITLSANGTGALVIPFRARLWAQGIVRIFHTTPPGNNVAECFLQTKSGLPIALTAVRLVPNATTTVSVMGAIDVTPGTL